MNVCFRQIVGGGGGGERINQIPSRYFFWFVSFFLTCLLMRGTEENSGFSGPVGRQASAG